jgi:hypothetical protein
MSRGDGLWPLVTIRIIPKKDITPTTTHSETADAMRNSVREGRALDATSQRTDPSTKGSLTETFDTDLYEKITVDKFAGYNTSIPPLRSPRTSRGKLERTSIIFAALAETFRTYSKSDISHYAKSGLNASPCQH